MAGYKSQLEEITLAAVAATAKLKPADVTAQVTAVTSAILTAAGAGSDRATEIQIAAAGAIGSTAVPASFATNLGAVKSAVDSSGYTDIAAMDTAIDFVQTKFSSFVKSDPTSAGTLASAYITAHHANADATVAAAVEMQPKAGADVITKALAAPHDGTATPVPDHYRGRSRLSGKCGECRESHYQRRPLDSGCH